MVMAGLNRGPSIRADFADVLDTVRRDAVSGIDAGGAGAASDPAAHASFDFLQALDTMSGQLSMGLAAGTPAARYGDAGAEAAGEEAPAAPLPPFEAAPNGGSETAVQHHAEPYNEACDPASLAAELGLRTGLKPAELQRIRRAFALRNHPDRLDPARRQAASRRMTLANSLIDEALRRAKSGR
jgi:hypothetical protein